MYGNSYGQDYESDAYHDDEMMTARMPLPRVVRVPVLVQAPRPKSITRDSIWTTYQGERVAVRDMTESHLFSAAAYLDAHRRFADWREWHRAFLDELQRRVLGTPPEGLSVNELDCLTEQTIADTASRSEGFYHDTLQEVRHGVQDPPSRTR